MNRILLVFVFFLLVVLAYGQDKVFLDEWSKGNVKVEMFRLDDELCFTVSKEDYSYTLNLNKENIVWKAMPEVKWISDIYVCVSTFWTGPFGHYAFLPLDDPYEMQYFSDINILRMDSVNNNICIDDSIIPDNKIFFSIQNLVTKKKKTASTSINENNGVYPYYTDIIFSHDSVKIITRVDTLVVDIRDIYPVKAE